MVVPEPPPFDPEITHPKKRAFLVALARTGNVSRSAYCAGIHTRTHYDWLESNEEDYQKKCALAKEVAADYLEEIARFLATVTLDTTMIIFLLKGLRPQVFRERYEHTGKDGGPIAVQPIMVSYDSAMKPPQEP